MRECAANVCGVQIRTGVERAVCARVRASRGGGAEHFCALVLAAAGERRRRFGTRAQVPTKTLTAKLPRHTLAFRGPRGFPVPVLGTPPAYDAAPEPGTGVADILLDIRL